MNAESGSADTRAQVVALARELGFDLCRFARAEMPGHAAEFRDWLDRGDAGEMNYLARNCGAAMRPAGDIAGRENGDRSRAQLFSGRAQNPACRGRRVACGRCHQKDCSRNRLSLQQPGELRVMPGAMTIIN